MVELCLCVFVCWGFCCVIFVCVLLVFVWCLGFFGEKECGVPFDDKSRPGEWPGKNKRESAKVTNEAEERATGARPQDKGEHCCG